MLQPEEARLLLAVMVYSFARVSTVVRMDVEDYYQQGTDQPEFLATAR